MRLIDADALEANGWMMQRTVRVDSQTMEWQQRKPTDFPAELYVTLEMYNSLDDYCKRLRRALAEATPVVHGKWMPIQKQPYFRKHFSNEVSCSVCHKKGHPAWNYCPNCGSRMDGGKDDV